MTKTRLLWSLLLVFIAGVLLSTGYFELTHGYVKSEYGSGLTYWVWLLLPAIAVVAGTLAVLLGGANLPLALALPCSLGIGLAATAVGYFGSFLACVFITHGACV